jgi:hypothetical protein
MKHPLHIKTVVLIKMINYAGADVLKEGLELPDIKGIQYVNPSLQFVQV